MPDNYYDATTGQWVTHETRYVAIVSQAKYESLADLIYSDPIRAWPLLLDLVAETAEDLVGFVGAGPVENFIWQNGAAFIEHIEAEARTNSRFRAAAFEINLARGHFPADIESRVVAAIGGGFELPALRPPTLSR
jgi:hypothetical protein